MVDGLIATCEANKFATLLYNSNVHVVRHNKTSHSGDTEVLE